MWKSVHGCLKPISIVLAVILSASLAAAATSERFELQVFGNFKRMTHTGDVGAKVKADELPKQPGTWGVGAMKNLEGEAMLFDGKLLLSRGERTDGRTDPPNPEDGLTLFVSAKVDEWVEIPIPMDMAQVQFERFVLEQAVAKGLGEKAAFPIMVIGRYPSMTWHVVTGAPAAGEASKHATATQEAQAGQRVFSRKELTGTLVGFYSGEQLEGVISHPGDKFHVHYADTALSISGHVDAYSVSKGSMLRLPVR